MIYINNILLIILGMVFYKIILYVNNFNKVNNILNIIITYLNSEKTIYLYRYDNIHCLECFDEKTLIYDIKESNFFILDKKRKQEISTINLTSSEKAKLVVIFNKIYYNQTTKIGYIGNILCSISYIEHLNSLEQNNNLKNSEIKLSIDSILDKLNKEGIESLSKDELEFLKNNK